MPKDTPGQEPNKTPENTPGQEPGQVQPEPTPDPRLVDLDAKSDDGKRLYFDAEAMRQVRDEAAQYRTLYQDVKKTLEALSTQADDDEAPKKPKKAAPDEPPPSEDLARRLEELEAREKTLRLENAILAEAARHTDDRAPFVDPRDALALVDKQTIELKDDGTASGVVEALTALAESKPHLLVQARRPGVKPTNPGQGGRAEPEIVRLLKARQMGQAVETFGGGGVHDKQE